MDEMREIVTVEQVNLLFLLLAVGGPILGVVIGAAIGARRGQTGRGAINGLLIGLFGVLNLATWRFYNALTDRMGLDSVKNLFVNLTVFVGLGVAAGLTFGYIARRRSGPSSGGGPFRDGGGSAPVGAGLAGPTSTQGPGAACRAEEADEPPRDQ